MHAPRPLAQIAFALLLGACGSEDLDIPLGDSTKTIVFAVERAGAAWAYVLRREERVPLRIDPGAHLVALLFDRTAEELRIEPGEAPVIDSAPSRELPKFDAAYETDAESGGIDPWVPISVLDPMLSEMRFREVPALECLERGACLKKDASCGECEPPMIQDPEGPAEPGFTCPEGQFEREDGTCIAFLGLPCTIGTAERPGDGACTTIGSACPVDDFADDLPIDVRFVKLGETGGDGSRARPFGTIAEALASGDGKIALAKGSYPEMLILSGQIALYGACAMQTTVDELTIESGSIALENLGAGRVNMNADDLTLRGVVIEQRLGVAGGAVNGDDLAIGGQLALDILAGARVSLLRVSIDGNINVAGALVLDRARVHIVDKALRLTEGAQLIAERMMLSGPAFAGMHFGASTATISDSLISDFDFGVLSSSAAIAIERSVIARTKVGISAVGSHLLIVRDGVLRDVVETAIASGAGEINVARLSIDGAQARSLDLFGRAVISDLRIAAHDPPSLIGLSVHPGSDLELDHALLSGQDTALQLGGPARVRNVLIEDSRRAAVERACAVDVCAEDVLIEHARLVRNATAVIIRPGTLHLSSITIEGDGEIGIRTDGFLPRDVSVTDFAIVRQDVGVRLGAGDLIRFERGSIAENGAGVISVDPLDLPLSFTEVRFFDNRQDFGGSE